MILLHELLEQLDEPSNNESVDPELLKLIDRVIIDTNNLVVHNLEAAKNILSKRPIDKNALEVVVSNYKRYFDRSNGGTPEVIRGVTMQNKLDQLSKCLVFQIYC